MGATPSIYHHDSVLSIAVSMRQWFSLKRAQRESVFTTETQRTQRGHRDLRFQIKNLRLSPLRLRAKRSRETPSGRIRCGGHNYIQIRAFEKSFLN
jgi:hypothetical protein